jgi:hypothetical protein
LVRGDRRQAGGIAQVSAGGFTTAAPGPTPRRPPWAAHAVFGMTLGLIAARRGAGRERPEPPLQPRAAPAPVAADLLEHAAIAPGIDARGHPNRCAGEAGHRMMDLRSRLRALEVATRPEHPDLTTALARRWDELPAHVRTAGQILGRRTAGCEGTHGVFPRCNLACTPCYHSREANRVRTDGDHTAAEVDRQMGFLHRPRPGQHAQLIGGEVTLLSPKDHARALLAMERHGRKPMSMSHGDFDYEHLVRLVEAGGFRHLSFAGHFDSLMFGRRGIRRARSEAELHPYRRRFVDMFRRLEREHGVTHYLAHNMTVTPRNIDQVADVVPDCRDMGFRMFSFPARGLRRQPEPVEGRLPRLHRRRRLGEIERGAGGRLHWRALQIGDPRCNRTAYGGYVGDR